MKENLFRNASDPPMVLEKAASDPLSLWERVGVRVRNASCQFGCGKEWDNEGYWGALTRPSATLSQRERG